MMGGFLWGVLTGLLLAFSGVFLGILWRYYQAYRMVRGMMREQDE
jgi:uncharacterized membrane protein YdjX (TVP38/TMEM64 family)